MAAMLWAASRAHHDNVRRTPFFQALASRRLPWRAYANWLAQLYLLHESLAEIESMLADPPTGPAAPRSARVCLPALAADLRFLHGEQWQQHVTACPATAIYCTDLRDTASGDAVGLLAHHYSRHIEDLYAAETLAPEVSAAYGLQDAGRRFLAPGDTDLWRYADSCHRLLDTLPSITAQSEKLVVDAARVHRMYLDIVIELGRTWA